MTPMYMQPHLMVIEVRAEFKEDGIFHPLSFVYDKEYKIDEVVEASVVKEEEFKALFPPPPDLPYRRVYKYKVRIGKSIRHLYFDVWPESGVLSLGRWFVNTKPQEEQ